MPYWAETVILRLRTTSLVHSCSGHSKPRTLSSLSPQPFVDFANPEVVELFDVSFSWQGEAPAQVLPGFCIELRLRPT